MALFVDYVQLACEQFPLAGSQVPPAGSQARQRSMAVARRLVEAYLDSLPGPA